LKLQVPKLGTLKKEERENRDERMGETKARGRGGNWA